MTKYDLNASHFTLFPQVSIKHWHEGLPKLKEFANTTVHKHSRTASYYKKLRRDGLTLLLQNALHGHVGG